MNEELKKLFEGADGFKPEFLTKIQAVVEAKVEAGRLAGITEAEARFETERVNLVEAHNEAIAALKETHLNDLVEKVSSFLDAGLLEWANANAPAIDAQIKTEASEAFLVGMASLFAEHNIVINGDSEGIVAGLQERLQVSESALKVSKEENKQIRESALEATRHSLIIKVCEGMADTQIATVKGLAEGLTVEDPAKFEERIKRFRGLVEGKSTKKEGDDGKDDGEDGKDKDGKDKGKDKDEAGKEVNESIAAQIAATLKHMKG